MSHPYSVNDLWDTGKKLFDLLKNPNLTKEERDHIMKEIESLNEKNEEIKRNYDESVEEGRLFHVSTEVKEKYYSILDKYYDEFEAEKKDNSEIISSLVDELKKLKKAADNSGFNMLAQTMFPDIPQDKKYVAKIAGDPGKRYIHITFPDNEGLAHASPIDADKDLPDRLVRSASAGDKGYNYTVRKPNGEYYSNEELGYPYIELDAKRADLLFDVKQYIKAVDAIAAGEIDKLYPKLSKKQLDSIFSDYDRLQVKFSKVKNDDKPLSNTKYGIFGTVARIDDIFVGGAPQYNLALPNDKLRELGIIKNADGSIPISPDFKKEIEDYYKRTH